MKTLLTILALAACSLVARAQTNTNLIFRIQQQVGTNITDTANFTWDYATKKDAAKVDGFNFAWAQAKSGGSQLSFVQWIKTDINDRAKSYADAKSAADNQALLAKLQSLLLLNPDLLTAGDLTSLNTIAAKAP